MSRKVLWLLRFKKAFTKFEGIVLAAENELVIQNGLVCVAVD